MAGIDKQEIMRAEVKADCYAGKNHDQVKNLFEIFCDGDMSSDTSTDDIVIKLAELPAGATVSVTYPCCPDCGTAREDKVVLENGGVRKIVGHDELCGCGFDWNEWVLNTYS